jgi:surface polysaccharide O-acyltransferase-like enzyme
MNELPTGKKTPRRANFELLRVLAMLFVVLGHLFGEGHLLAHAGKGAALGASVALGWGARVAVNLFVLAGCWFLVEATRPGMPAFAPGRRWWKLHFTVLCWTVPLTVAALAMGAHPAAKDVAKGFLPYFGRPLWFASAWMTLLLAVPFLRRALAWEGRKLGGAVALGGVVFVVNSTLADFRDGYLTDVFWFLYLYFFVGWARLHAPERLKKIPGWVALVGGLAVYAALVVPEWWARAEGLSSAAARTVHRVAEWYLSDIKSAPNFLCAVSLFAFFAKLDIGSVRWINAAARPAFAVYVAHQTPAFWPLLWPRIVQCPAWWGRPWTPLAAVGVALAIYAAVGIVEAARLRWVEPLWLRSKLSERLAGMLDRFAAG